MNMNKDEIREYSDVERRLLHQHYFKITNKLEQININALYAKHETRLNLSKDLFAAHLFAISF